jgi:anaerobic nitric oxide reductase flavorubredoxin
MRTEIKPGIHWVGVVDWDLRHFHGHELSTHRGSTYNAYLIVDEKVALVDTVWGPFAPQLMANIAAIVDPARIDYVIASHAEADHSGALPEVMRHAPRATVVVSKRGAESVPGHYHAAWPMRAVGTGERLSLGRRELLFVEAPMLHWPDSMFTYVPGDALLLPNDAFGQHYASAFRYNDEVDQNELFEECLKYYANILTPFSPLVERKIAEFVQLGLPVDMIAPSHGVIWRKDPLQIVGKYREWAAQRPEPRAVVIYDTMWNATRDLANAIADGLRETGVEHRVFHAATADRNDTITEVFRSRAIAVGSPTLNNGLLPTIWPVLQDMKGLKFKNKLGAAFGSYGWSGEGVGLIEEHLRGIGFGLPAPGVKAKWQPDAATLEQGRDLGRRLGEAVRQ